MTDGRRCRYRRILIYTSHHSLRRYDLYGGFTGPHGILRLNLHRVHDNESVLAGDTQLARNDILYGRFTARRGAARRQRVRASPHAMQRQSCLSRPQSRRTMPQENRHIYTHTHTYVHRCLHTNMSVMYRHSGLPTCPVWWWKYIKV